MLPRFALLLAGPLLLHAAHFPCCSRLGDAAVWSCHLPPSSGAFIHESSRREDRPEASQHHLLPPPRPPHRCQLHPATESPRPRAAAESRRAVLQDIAAGRPCRSTPSSSSPATASPVPAFSNHPPSQPALGLSTTSRRKGQVKAWGSTFVKRKKANFLPFLSKGLDQSFMGSKSSIPSIGNFGETLGIGKELTSRNGLFVVVIVSPFPKNTKKTLKGRNEEDWATKAKAWAATKYVTENQQMQQHAISTSRNENHNYGYRDQYQQTAGLPTEVTEPLHPPVPQSSNDHMPFPMTGQQRDTNHSLDRGPLASPGKNSGSFPSNYEQEVSYNYSSAPGNGNVMLQYPTSQAQPFPAPASVQDGFPQGPLSMPIPSMEQPPFVHEQHSVDPSDQPLEFNSRKAPDMPIYTTVASNHDAVVASTHSWMPSVALGLHSRPPVPPQVAQMDPSVHAAPLFGAISGSNYVPPAAFGVGSVTDVFPTDPNTPFNAAEKSKKPPVPNWLREELLKKKSAPLSAPTQQLSHLDSMESNDIEQPLRRPDQSDSRSNDSAKSTEDDESEIEAARTAAINQEIKRVLTEVLLKVTDDLFDEIATKVLNEDDSSAEFNEPMGVSALKEPGESKTKTPAKVILPAKPPNIISSDHRDSKELSSGKGALLGLANYNSDDDDDSGDGNDKPVSNLSSETNAGTANPEKKSSHGSTSLGENVKVVDKITQRINAEPKHEHTHDTQNGEFPLDAKTLSQPKDCHKMDEKAYRHLEKSGKGTLVKEEKADHTKELESSIGEKYDNDGKCSMYDKKGSIKENKGSDRIAKHEWDTREPHNRIDSKHDDAKGDRKDIRKDTRERNMDSTDRRGSRGKDEKEDRSRQITKSSTSHGSRRSRSRSPRGRSRTRKESSTSHSSRRSRARSDERSDNKRKLHSHKNSMSPSPPKSRNRRVSPSPHSKHSHHRHSPYSSADRKRRSRSRTPVKRR